CRTPWCNAPIKHFDHVVQHSRGGPTSEVNSAGRCASCNQTKEQAGWEERVVDSGGRHTIEITTPVGATYTSTAPPLPGTPG
ncbi:HNH endonuclease, partial [Paeniglutamicibacter psychrophenolicus]